MTTKEQLKKLWTAFRNNPPTRQYYFDRVTDVRVILIPEQSAVVHAFERFSTYDEKYKIDLFFLDDKAQYHFSRYPDRNWVSKSVVKIKGMATNLAEYVKEGKFKTTDIGKFGGKGRGKKKELEPGKDKHGRYTDTPEGRSAFMRDELKRREDQRERYIREQKKIDAQASLVPDPANSMSEKGRAEYWGKYGNATIYLSKQLESAHIRGLKILGIHGVLGIVKAQLVEGGHVKMNFEVKIPFHYKSARREDIPRSVEKVRAEVDHIWDVLTPRSKK
jgi:hypothetical protein